jgi:hypothetical protein
MYRRTDIMNTVATRKENKGSIKESAFEDFLNGQKRSENTFEDFLNGQKRSENTFEEILNGQKHVENTFEEILNGQKRADLSKCKMINKIF